MQNFTPAFWLQLITTLVTLGTFGGYIKAKLDDINTKLDRLRDIGERVTRTEESTKSAHHRLDSMERAFEPMGLRRLSK